MYIIIGQGAAGTAAANELRRLDPATPVTIITEERDCFYSRIDLPDIIAGKYAPASAELQSAESFAARGISCRMGERVMAIRPDKHTIELSGGEELKYTKLLLATGSSSLVPPLPGSDAAGIHTVWTMAQAESLIAAANRAKTAVVIGAGLIGIKTALALAARGLAVTLVEKMPRVLPRQLDETAAVIVAQAVQVKGVKVLTGIAVERFVTTPAGVVRAVKLPDGELACDLVVMAVGVKPNTALAEAAGLTVQRGIVVDEYLQTSAQAIYAAGDAAAVRNKLTGGYIVPAIWPEAVEQGLAAARNMAGKKYRYQPGAAMNSVEVAGVPLVSVGDIEAAAGDEVLVCQRGQSYRKVVVRDGIICGILCVGDIRPAGALGNLVLRRASIDQTARLLSPTFGFADLLAV